MRRRSPDAGSYPAVTERGRWPAILGLCLSIVWCGPIAAAQTPIVQAPPTAAPTSITAAFGIERSGESHTVTVANRLIVTLRARLLGRSPAERAAGAETILESLIEEGISGPVETRTVEGSIVVAVASRGVLVVTPADIDDLSGETLQGVASLTRARLQQALSEAIEAHTPRILLRSAVFAAVALAAAGLLLWGLVRGRRIAAAKFTAIGERTLAKTAIGDLEALRASRVLDIQQFLVTAVTAVVGLFIVYSTFTFVLRSFPYTRPWGESMNRFLVTTVQDLALSFANAIPGLFTVALIFVLVRFVVRAVGLWFNAVERGRIRAPWLFPETAQPTRRLVTTLLWLVGLIMAYPYMPGTQTDAFKGVSVFLGLMVTFGSSGIVNQIMSGFMITYSRALRVGDFVKIGDIEGTVTHLGVLSTKVRTLRNEEVTIPNAVVVSTTSTDYSRTSETQGVFTPTSVTIGYDAPWRQVHAMLLEAAGRTPGLRRDPKPLVIQASLDDFYVKYALMVCLERQDSKPFTLNVLHAHIQDVFNEHGVQIMSPNYVLDPAAPKVVAKKDWFAPPASPDS